jgi:hypothetical protein
MEQEVIAGQGDPRLRGKMHWSGNRILPTLWKSIIRYPRIHVEMDELALFLRGDISVAVMGCVVEWAGAGAACRFGHQGAGILYDLQAWRDYTKDRCARCGTQHFRKNSKNSSRKSE